MEQKINIKGELKSKDFNYEFKNEDMKLLLSENEHKKINAIKTLGLDDEIKAYEKIKAQDIDKKNYEDEYGPNIFHIDDIKNLCFKYDLRFLTSKDYKGKIKSFLIDNVVNFTDKHKIALNGSYVDSDFMILDVRENFKNTYWNELRFKNVFSVKNNNDPFLFYSVGQNHYKLIYSNDYFINIFRLLKAWKRKSLKNRYFYFMIMISLFIMPILGYLGIILIASVIFSIILSGLITLILIPWKRDLFDHGHNFFIKNGWNYNN